MDAVHVEVFWSLVDVRGPDDCWVWKGAVLKRDEYGMFCGRRAHVVAYELHSGAAAPAGQVVRHSCDNRPCVNPGHLLLGTHGDNAQDRTSRGRSCQNWGESSGRAARLSERECDDIRERFGRGESPVSIHRAAYSHVSYTTVWGVARGVYRINGSRPTTIAESGVSAKTAKRRVAGIDPRSLTSEAERCDIRDRHARGERVQSIRLSSYPHLSYDYVHNIAVGRPRSARSKNGERSISANKARTAAVKA